jgi:hypothetical protein
MRSVKPAANPATDSELLLPPLRTTATIITMLTAAFLVVIIFAHLALGDPGIAGRMASRTIAPSVDSMTERAASYPYTDPRTIGLY